MAISIRGELGELRNYLVLGIKGASGLCVAFVVSFGVGGNRRDVSCTGEHQTFWWRGHAKPLALQVVRLIVGYARTSLGS